MVKPMTHAKPSVDFEVLLRTAGEGRLATAHNIDQFRADPENAERCRRWLHAKGVKASATDFSLACSAPAAVFESLFGVKLVPVRAAPGHLPWRVKGTIRVPPEIAPLVEDVTLSPPPEFFASLRK